MTESSMISSTYSPKSVFDPSVPKLIEEATILYGQDLARLRVIGKITKSMPTTGTAGGSNTGNGTMTGVTAGLKTKLGAYIAKLISLDGGSITTPTAGTKTGTGDGTMTGVSAGSKAIAGTYTVTCKSKTGGTLTVPTTGTKTGTGNGTMTSVTGGSLVKAGSYIVTCKTAADSPAKSVFSVKDPDGFALPDATEATAYVNSQINFTITEGLTPFIVGDYFTVATTNGGLFSVKAPNGANLPDASVGVAYTNSQINFTINDGSVDFIVGDYFTVLAGNGGLWEVKDPEGLSLPDAKTGVAYSNAALNFTINDGSVDYVVDDTFIVTVAAGSGKWKESVATAVDGSQEELAILMDDADATSADVVRTAATKGSIAANNVTYDSSWSESTITSALRKCGIYLIAA